MTKSKMKTKQLLHCFMDDLNEQFPGLTFEPVVDPEDGNDAWLRILIPAGYQRPEAEIRTAAETIEDGYWRENAISIVPMIRQRKEAVHG